MTPPPPTDGQTAADALRHVSQSHLASAIGWVVATLAGIVVALLGYIGVRESKKVNALFAWKDDVVDPALRDIPGIYATKKECDDCRETIHRYVTEPNEKAHDEMKEHLKGIDGKLDQLLLRR